MEQKYLVSLMDGIKFWVTDINLSKIRETMNKHSIFAIKIGNKSFPKHSIGFIANAGAIEEDGHNVVINLNNELIYIAVEDTDKEITELTDELNEKDFILRNDAVLFNRGLFKCAEPC